MSSPARVCLVSWLIERPNLPAALRCPSSTRRALASSARPQLSVMHASPPRERKLQRAGTRGTITLPKVTPLVTLRNPSPSPRPTSSRITPRMV